MYEIIEKNEYGVLVRKIKSIPTECEKCKYTGLAVTLQPCKSCKVDNSYYLTDKEAEKLESEKPTINGTTPDVVNLNSDTQKELIDLRCELRVEKEKSKALEEYSRGLELKIKELEQTIENMKAIAGEKIEPINGVTSVDYPRDNETEVFEKTTYCDGIKFYTLATACCEIPVINNENYCPNCGRKIKK